MFDLDLLYEDLAINESLLNEMLYDNSSSDQDIEELSDAILDLEEKIAFLEMEETVYKLMHNPMHNNDTDHLPNTPNTISLC